MCLNLFGNSEQMALPWPRGRNRHEWTFPNKISNCWSRAQTERDEKKSVMWNGRKFRTRYEANCQMMHLHQLNCNYEHLEELTREPWTVDQLAGTCCIHRKWHVQSQLLFKGSSLKTPKLRENSEELLRSSCRALLKISQSINGCTARAEQHAAAMPLFSCINFDQLISRFEHNFVKFWRNYFKSSILCKS